VSVLKDIVPSDLFLHGPVKDHVANKELNWIEGQGTFQFENIHPEASSWQLFWVYPSQ
jgi:hypothetical protein